MQGMLDETDPLNLQENHVITYQQRYITKLFHNIRVLSHTLQFGSCEEQINDTTGYFMPNKQKIFEHHEDITPELIQCWKKTFMAILQSLITQL